MKNLFTESFNSRLLKYSVTAGAVLLGAKEADAQVWGTSVNQVLTNKSYTISFNGNDEFVFKQKDMWINPSSSSSSSLLSSTHYATGWIKPLSNSAGWVNNNADPKPLSSGYIVSAGKGFSVPGNTNSDQFFRRENHFSSFIISTHNTYSGAGFIGKGDKYIGVKFHLTDGIHYGWIKINVNSDGSILKIISYAYNQTAGAPITTDGALPVELTTFTANNFGDKVELKWNTATEVNNYGFDIERTPLNPSLQRGETASAEEGWEKIGFVKGSGNSNSPKSYSFVDENPLSGVVEYRLKQIDNDGQVVYSKIVEVTSLPTQFKLAQNYPNPFNPTTTIQYAIPKAEHVTIKVYDELGNEVKTLVDADKAAGQYNIQFNGSGLASGIYYYRIIAGNFTEVKKLMLLK